MADSPQIPFVGGSYQLARKKADDQRTINMMVTAIESGTGKSRVYLQSVPGLTVFSIPVAATNYYTSLIYPYLDNESLTIPVPTVQNGYLFPFADVMHQQVTSIQSGTLTVSVHYLSYTNQRDLNPDTMTQSLPTIQSGTLAVTINYINYINKRDVNPDTMTQPLPVIRSGSLVVTITYASYTNKRDVNPDTMNQPIPTIQSGTLA